VGRNRPSASALGQDDRREECRANAKFADRRLLEVDGGAYEGRSSDGL